MDTKGLIVILRFHYGRRGSINPIISKTLGRVSVIAHSYQGAMPQPDTFWVCRIERELISEDREGSGCFVVTPLKQTDLASIVKLVPGAYDMATHGTTSVCKPRIPNMYWIMPFSLKKYLIKKDKTENPFTAVIVPLELEEFKN